MRRSATGSDPAGAPSAEIRLQLFVARLRLSFEGLSELAEEVDESGEQLDELRLHRIHNEMGGLLAGAFDALLMVAS